MPSKNNQHLGRRNYMWDITNFGPLAMLFDTGDLLLSPLLKIRSTERMWEFHIYPKGKSSEDYISFYLFKAKISDKAVYNCTLSIGRPEETPVKYYKYIDVRFLGNGIGEDFFLWKKYNSRIFRGLVRFRCDITEIYQENQDSIHETSYKPVAPFNLVDTANLSLDLEELLKTPFRSDLTVNMNGQEMYIHKYILKVSCPNMKFGYDSVMDMPSYIETDINDEIFELLMHFIYTGRLRNSYVPLELFRLAERFSLTSLMYCLHEQSYHFQAYSTADVENQIINWDLDELNFFEEGSTFVHILRTTLDTKQLVIQVSRSDDSGKEKFIDISFKFFNIIYCEPILLISKISLTSQSGLEAFQEAHHVFRQEEQWDFPLIPCQKDEYMYIPGMTLKAEISISDGSNLRMVRCIKSKTKLFTNFQTVTDNLDNLRGYMNILFQTVQSTSNLILLSSDNQFFRVHDGILWARWPGFRKLIDNSSVSSDEELNDVETPMELNMPSEVLNILLPYLYTGFIENFDRAKAELLLEYSNYLQYPHHLVNACEALLCDHHENQC